MQLVDLQDVSRSYGRIRALSHVTLSLEPGIVGLVGNNGAGKSTLLKILLGLLRPDSGRGSVLGCELSGADRRLRGRIGYMPEAAVLVPLLRGVEFVTLSGDLYGMPHGDARRRAHEVLNYVGLGELRYRRLEEYSSGNLQRLKLAAALVHDPQLLLLDEPTNGLDPAGRAGMLRLIEDLIGETGKSVILCTHLLGDVERLCDHVVVLHRGSVFHAGPLASLKQPARNRFQLAWRDNGALSLADGLRHAGCHVESLGSDAWQVETPAEFEVRGFFELAHAAGAILTRVVPEEENLERLFFRVTDEPATV